MQLQQVRAWDGCCMIMALLSNLCTCGPFNWDVSELLMMSSLEGFLQAGVTMWSCSGISSVSSASGATVKVKQHGDQRTAALPKPGLTQKRSTVPLWLDSSQGCS